jgi:hypothetical protein
MVSLNNLTDQSQFITTGTSGTNFNIVSSGDTHTFNLPVASAANTGKLSSSDWSVFNAKEPAIAAGNTLQYYRGDKTFQTLDTTAVIEATNLYFTDARARAAISLTTTNTSGAATYNNTTGVLNIPDYSANTTNFVTIGTTQTITGTKTFNEAIRNESGLLLKNGVLSGLVGYTSLAGITNGLNVQLSGSSNAQSLIFQSAASYSYTFPASSGTLALASDLSSYVPTSRELTINGTTYDLSANRSWTITGITGSGTSGQVPYFDGPTSLTSEAGFIYDASTNRLGVNTSVPNATIGADAALNSGYGLLIKTGASNYNGIGIAIDSTYGNTIETAKLGTASARNLTLLNQSGFISLTEAGNLGVNILTPNFGIDIYNSTQSQLWLHNAASGLTATDGVRLALFNNLSANLRNFDGGLSLTAEGDFSIITIGTENLKVNSANGYVAIGGPATITSMLTVNGAITQSSVTSALLKTNASGTLVAAVAGTDYVTPSALIGYLPLSGGTLTGTLNGTIFNSSNYSRFYNVSIGGAASGTYALYSDGVIGVGNLHLATTSGAVYINSALALNAIINPVGGNVMIGTSVDSGYRLDVAGSTRVSGALTGTSATFSSTITSSRNDSGNVSATLANTFINQGNLLNFVQNTGGATTNAFIGHGGDSTGNFVIINNGFTALQIDRANGYATFNGVAPILTIKSNTTGNVFLRFNQGVDVVSSMFYNNATSTLNVSNNNGGIRFSTIDVSGAVNITNAGNVSIGSSTTNGKLDVQAAGLSAFSIFVRNSNGGYGGGFYNTGGNNTSLYLVNSANTENVLLNSSGTSFLNGGNVLIGTTSDGGYKLSVVGTAFVSGNFNYNTGSAIYPRTTTVDDWYLCKHNQSIDRIENGIGTNKDFTIGNHSGGIYYPNIFLNGGGNATFNGAVSKGSGSFKIDHPLESMTETHHLVHSFVESPQANNIYRGKVQLVNGKGEVNLDEVSTMTKGTFVALNREIHTYTSNETDWDAVRGKVEGNILTIECQNNQSNAIVSWLVIGERQDKHMMDTDWTDDNGKVIVEPLKTN